MDDLERIDNCITGVKRLHDEIGILRTALTWAKARISPKMEETHSIIDEALRFGSGQAKPSIPVNDMTYPITSQIDLMEPAEIAIREAMLAVEKLPGHPLLTDTTTLLDQARQKIAEWRDVRPMTAEEQKMVDTAWDRHKAAQPTRRPQDWVVTALDGFFAREGSDMPTKTKGALVAQMALACTGIQGEVEVKPFEDLIMGE